MNDNMFFLIVCMLMLLSVFMMNGFSFIINKPIRSRYGTDSIIITNENTDFQLKQEEIVNEPPKEENEIVYPYVTKEELVRNASVVRFDYYQDVPYPFVKYEKDLNICNASFNQIPATTENILKRHFMKINSSGKAPTWENYDIMRRKRSNSSELLKEKYSWWYSENVCLENNTNTLHIYTTNYTHFLQLNQTTWKLCIPHDTPNYRHTLHIQMHYETIPSNLKTLDNAYVIINRGWNNMYHHSEWIIQLLRYMLFSDFFPPMNTVIQFPDIDWINHHTHDFKGHYRYARGYLDLALNSFKADLQGVDKTPTLFEGEEYQAEKGIICAKQMIVVPIITDMIKPFIDKREAYQMRMLAYKKFHAPLPLGVPKNLFLLYMDRKTANRGIKNQDEILEILSSYPGTEFHHQVNQQMSFSEQVISMFKVDILFTVHGAGLTNVIFMLPGSALIEVFPPLFREPYYMYAARSSDIIYQRISETKIINKKDYMYIRRKIDYTNKVFYLPPHLVEEKLANVTVRVWDKKYSLVKCF